MMRGVLWLLMVIGGAARAESMSFVFDRVAMPEFVRTVYGSALGRSYVFDREVVEEQAPLSVSLRNVEVSKVEALAEAVLKDAGYRVRDIGGVLRFGKDKPEDRTEAFIYRPQHRSVAYLSELIAPLFPAGRFGGQQRASGPFSFSTGPVSGPSPGIGPSGLQAPVLPSAAVAPAGLVGAQGRDSDVLVFRGDAAEVERLQGFLKRLDVATPELVVRAVVYEVQSDDVRSSAVSVVASILGGKLGVAIGATPTGDYRAVLKGFAGFDAAYAALSADSRFKSVSSPSVRVKSGGRARFSVGADTPVLGAVAYQPTGSAVQSVNYQSSGIILELSPVVRDSVVEMKVVQHISNFAPTTNGVNGSPTLLKRELTTDIGFAFGELVVLGGLTDNRDGESSSGVPFLPRWLRSSGSTVGKSELVLVLSAERL